ncbi:long-chain fatty acid--CoA ligase [Virgibacillus dokdonensis]|uniref:Long-chain-fatty-acid--CoA ligase n=1 Tax=Virgibacillus dokdonensis TaxID=302167 RepID=A0A2K9J7N6_9BACI|nr:long-chain fatty acid--CoA ligase [Virgibacillus dokdonensis]AUJ25530.1 Long-chain-fatty-acid--CoA ligase [Virgibacillus dokdonensis]
MMDSPLLITSLIERAENYFPNKEIISRTQKYMHRLTYKELGGRVRALAHALKELGIQKGDRVGTFAWNHHRHLEAYFAVPSIGAILHTINIRLSAEQLGYIINHAEDKVILVDEELLPAIESIFDQLETVETIIVMTDEEVVPASKLPSLLHYEQFLEDGDATFAFKKDMEEEEAAELCYTSGTTGKPKGVVYSHRGLVLHAMALSLADTSAVSEEDVSMPVVPMFHANAWGMPHAATWMGAKQVLPGPYPTPEILARLIETEKVTITAGVPTIWLGLLKELDKKTYQLDSLRGILCGGSAAPFGMIKAFEMKHKIPFFHAYGMTETTPLALFSKLKSSQKQLSEMDKLDIKSKQGMAVPGIEIKAINENGDIKRDGREMGELLIRGPWIADSYYKDDRSDNSFLDGWLYTGDVVTIDEEGFVKIVDRTKDLIKSGGEWISSVDLENALMAHEAVYEAAVVSVPHEKWQERPVACVVLKDDYRSVVGQQDLYAFLEAQFVKWWLPDDILFMDALPKTSVGKFLKTALREEVKKQLTKEF